MSQPSRIPAREVSSPRVVAGPDRIAGGARGRAPGFVRRSLHALLAAGIAALAGCTEGAAPDPLLREPALLADGPALTRLLARTEALSDTPLGHRSKALLSRLAGCPEIAAHFDADSAPTGHDPLDALVCRSASPIDAKLAQTLATRRDDHDGLLQWPVGATGRLALLFDVDEHGGLAISGTLDGGDELGALALLVPHAEPPAKALLADAASLVHLQVRPLGGVALSALVPAGSQGDRLFALKGRLLEGTLLEGTLELALLPPAANGHVPLTLVALHHRAAAPIDAAVAEVLARLEKTWGITPTQRTFGAAGAGERRGGCYASIPLLPELAPCWVVTGEALLIGYRAEAIEAALASTAPSDPKADPTLPLLPAEAMSRRETRALPVSAPPRATSHLLVDFDGFRAADRIRIPDGASARLADVYERLEVEGHAEPGGPVRFEARLRARP